MGTQDIVQLPHQHIGHLEGEDLKAAIERNFKEISHMLYILQLYEKKTGKPINETVNSVTDENGNLLVSKLSDKMVGLENELKLADLAVTAAKLAVAAVVAEKIADNAITETKIAEDSISTPKLQANAITAAKIAANAVVAVNIAANAITAEKIAADAVTADKINVNELASITAYLGTVISGEIFSSEFSTRASGEVKAYAELLTNGDINIYDTSAALGLKISGGNGQGMFQWFLSGIEYARSYVDAGTYKDLVIKSVINGIRLQAVAGPEIHLSKGGAHNTYLLSNSVAIDDESESSNASVVIWGDLLVTGTMDAGDKQCVEDTSQGKVGLYTIESPEVRYIDEGIATLINGECRIDLDPIFLECVEPDSAETPWHTRLTPKGPFTVYEAEIVNSYFIVKSHSPEVNGKFTWEISAIRKNKAGIRFPKMERLVGGNEENDPVLLTNWEDELLSGV